MARPRRPFGGVEDIQPLNEGEYLSAILGTRLGVRQRGRWDASSHWTYKQPNGQYDPLTYMHVLDVLASIDPDIELRAAKLVDYLEDVRDRFSWDSVTVGKILSDICDSFSEILGEGHGILERGKDYKGTFYRVHHTDEVAVLYASVHEELMRLTQIEMDQRAMGQKIQHLASPLLEVAALRPAWKQDA